MKQVKTVQYYNKELKSIYLAGKIDRGDWRHDLVKELHGSVRSCFGDIYQGKQWPVLKSAVFDLLDYTGPYFVSDDHNASMHGDDEHGTGAQGLRVDTEIDGHGIATGMHRRDWTVLSCRKAIEQTDLLFAWIDCTTCYGTIAEIGYAKALGKVIWIGGPRKYRDLWFVYEMADNTLFDREQSPEIALREMLDFHIKTSYILDSPIEQRFWDEWLEYVGWSNDTYRLVPQHPIGRYRVDFAHISTRTVVELDGFASHSSTDDIANDRKRQREIEEMGWHVIRFGGKEIHNDVRKCVEETLRRIYTRISSPPLNDTNTANSCAIEKEDVLTLDEVLGKWEWIKKRIRTKKDGAIVAAVLNDCSPIETNDEAKFAETPPVLHVATPSTFHHRIVHKYMDLVLWAVKIEIGVAVRVVFSPPSE